MSKTLTIDFETGRDPGLRLAGLSLYKIDSDHLNRDEAGRIVIDTHFAGRPHGGINGRTAQIWEDFLIEILVEIYEAIPFDRIKYIGHYELPPDELLEKVKLKANE